MSDPVSLLLSPALVDDPYPVYERLREQGAVAVSEFGPLVVTGHSEAAEVLRDWASDRRLIDPDADMSDASLLNLDPPDHTRIRALVAPAFSARRIEKLTHVTEKLAQELVTSALHKRDIDVMRDLAYPLPLGVICTVLGVAVEDQDRIRDWGYRLAPALDINADPTNPETAQLMQEVDHFFEKLIAQRRRDPGDDMTSLLLEAQKEGAGISDRELLNLCTLLLMAGFVTTVNLIGNGVDAFLTNPKQWEAVRADPTLIPGAVDEVLRFASPVQYTSRIAKEQTALGGLPVPRGTIALVLIGAANRDPIEFPDPGCFDVTRGNANRHLAFTLGIHHCLGAALARMEGRALFEALVGHVKNVERLGEPTRRPITNLRGFDTLPVSLTDT